MKRAKIITMVLTFVMWGGLQAVSAQVTDRNQQNETQDNINQEMVSDAWERDWDNMNDQERQTFSDEWNNSTNTTERQQRREQELNNMSTQERNEHDSKLRERRNEWQRMSSNERNEFGQRVQDYNTNNASTNRNNTRR